MEVYQIAVNVGIGQPYNGELIFNFHFISFVGVEWTSSFSYGQLCQMDNYINFNTAKIKHVAFPVVSTSRQQRILQLIENDNSYAFSLQTSKRMIEKLRSMLEIWAAVVLMRLHAMPLAVQDIVEKFFSLPHGPNYVESADNSASSSSSAAKKPSSLFGFLKLNIGHIDKGDTYESVIRTEDEAESSKPPMLRLSVVRGPEGPHGKQEYQISIFHSHSISEAAYNVYRRFSEFAALYTQLNNSEARDSMFCSFPVPPFKLGMALDESELSVRTRQLDAWLRDVAYHYRLMSSAGKAAVRTFLNIVASTRDDHVPERDGALPTPPRPAHGGAGRHPSFDSVGSGGSSGAAGRAQMLESIQIRLADGLFEAPRAENYDHVMKGAMKNRNFLQNRGLGIQSPVASSSASKRGLGRSPKAGAGAGAMEQDDDDTRSEDSRMDEDVLNEAAAATSTTPTATKTVKPFSFRSMFGRSKSGSSHASSSATSDASTTPGALNAHSPHMSLEDLRVNRYIVPEAVVSGENPFLSPFLGSNIVTSKQEQGIMGMLESPFAENDHKPHFHIRYQDFDPQLFVFSEEATSPKDSSHPRISSNSSVAGKSPGSVLSKGGHR